MTQVLYTVQHYFMTTTKHLFWVTVCKTVRPMLSDHLSVLSVTLVYCGQTVGWIKMKLGMQVAEVGLGPGHIAKMPLGMAVGLSPGDFVLDGEPAPLRAPNFRPTSIVAKRLHGSKCHLVRRQASAYATLC